MGVLKRVSEKFTLVHTGQEIIAAAVRVGEGRYRLFLPAGACVKCGDMLVRSRDNCLFVIATEGTLAPGRGVRVMNAIKDRRITHDR